MGLHIIQENVAVSTRLWRQEQLKAHISKLKQETERWIHFFQQGYISQASPNKVINWGPSIQMPDTLGDIYLSNYYST